MTEFNEDANFRCHGNVNVNRIINDKPPTLMVHSGKTTPAGVVAARLTMGIQAKSPKGLVVVHDEDSEPPVVALLKHGVTASQSIPLYVIC